MTSRINFFAWSSCSSSAGTSAAFVAFPASAAEAWGADMGYVDFRGLVGKVKSGFMAWNSWLRA